MRVLFAEGCPYAEDLAYPREPDGTRRAQGVVSREKQWLGVILGLLEG